MTVFTDNIIFLVSGVQRLSHSGDTISISRNLTIASPSTFVSAVPLTFSTSNTSASLIQTIQPSDLATNILAVRAQDAYAGAVTNVLGGNLTLSSGLGTTAGNSGSVLIQTGGTTGLSVSPTHVTIPGIVSAAYLSTDGSGNITAGTSLAVTNITPGTSGQILMSNATPATTWTTMSGDVTISATGATTVGKLDGYTITNLPSGAGNALVYAGGTSLAWSPISLGGGSASVTGTLPTANQAQQSMVGDVTGTTGANTVSKISGTSPFAINPASLAWLLTTASPTLTQTTITTGTTSQNLTIQAQSNSNASSTGGNLILKAGTGTTSNGKVQIASGQNVNTTSITTTYTVLASDYIILSSGVAAYTITLPAFPSSGDTYVIKDANGSSFSFPITVSGNGNNIDGASTYTINTNYAALTLVYNSTTKWSVF